MPGATRRATSRSCASRHLSLWYTKPASPLPLDAARRRSATPQPSGRFTKTAYDLLPPLWPMLHQRHCAVMIPALAAEMPRLYLRLPASAGQQSAAISLVIARQGHLSLRLADTHYDAARSRRDCRATDVTPAGTSSALRRAVSCRPASQHGQRECRRSRAGLLTPAAAASYSANSRPRRHHWLWPSYMPSPRCRATEYSPAAVILRRATFMPRALAQEFRLKYFADFARQEAARDYVSCVSAGAVEGADTPPAASGRRPLRSPTPCRAPAS